jgi:hypothetical protein
MVIYLIAIGFLTYGYARVSNCLSDYANKSAASTNARAEAAATDRALNDAESKLSDADRVAFQANDTALSDLLVLAGNPGVSEKTKKDSFDKLIKTNQSSAKSFAANEREREVIRGKRADVEQQRKANPVPPPPSQTC